MAFNFNWSPLIADTERARDMLTTALNKSPKPPIIVDDITVNELNLGSTPPELEILEIGDLAEDRFRGIFKMRYNGDAYLTLKTRVQANPLNTYLSTKPGFASPETVAASSGLTIPLQITLSEIRLSGFVILVFSKQKGITTVFRNDPLEGLKVSSTFDSIPFVRDYLQKTIESQLRVLFMEDLPSIIHRLSLRVFNPEAQAAEYPEPKTEAGGQAPVDPFSSPPQQVSDGDGWPIDDPTEFSLHSQGDIYPNFSQKNLLRLATLTESQRTLSLFTPHIRDTVYRAWANTADRVEANSGSTTPLYQKPTAMSMSKIQASLGGQTASAKSSVSSHASENESHASRPTMSSLGSSPTIYTLSSGKSRPRGQRKRKNRVVNLRKNRGEADGGEGGLDSPTSSNFNDGASYSSGYTESAGQGTSTSRSVGHGASSTNPTTASPTYERDSSERGHGKKAVGFQPQQTEVDLAQDASGAATIRQPRRPHTPRHSILSHSRLSQTEPHDEDATPRASQILHPEETKLRGTVSHSRHHEQHQHHPQPHTGPHLESSSTSPEMKSHHHDSHHHRRRLSQQDLMASPFNVATPSGSSSTGGILESAWMMKMQQDLARRVAEERAKGNDFWRSPSSDSLLLRGNSNVAGAVHSSPSDEDAPPAYTS